MTTTTTPPLLPHLWKSVLLSGFLSLVLGGLVLAWPGKTILVAAIFFGAWFRLEDPDGNPHHYRIVGPDEIDPRLGYISIDSPLARALLKKKADDEVTAQLPAAPASSWCWR